MRRLIPVIILIILNSFALVIFKLNGMLPNNSTALLILLSLELILIGLSGFYYIGFRFDENNTGIVISSILIGVLIAYVFYSFKLYSTPIISILVLGSFFTATFLLWASEEKTLRYYLGILTLGATGGTLIYHRFMDLSWISIMLGIMTAVLIISLSLLLEEEDEKTQF